MHNLTEHFIANRVRSGWLPASTEDHRTLLLGIAKSVEGELLSMKETSSSNVSSSVLALSRIRLRGMDAVPCLIVTSYDESSRAAVDDQCRHVDISRIGIILTMSKEVFAAVQGHVSRRQWLVLAPQHIPELLLAEDGSDLLRRLLLDSFGRLTLVPFNLLRPVDAHMFFGRRFDLDKLLGQATASFALCGPEGLGKTSLLHQYERELIRAKDPRAVTRTYVNFLSCSDTTDASILRYLAMKIDPRKQS